MAQTRSIGLFLSIFMLIFLELTSQSLTINPYIQNTNTSSTNIFWETNGRGKGEVIYGRNPNQLNKTTISINTKIDATHYVHNAFLTGLKSQKKYFYRIVMADGETSELYSFQTLDALINEPSTQVVLLSDPEQDLSFPEIFEEIITKGIAQKIEEEVSYNASGLEAIFLMGDLINPEIPTNQWRSHFFPSGEKLFPYLPFYVVPGQNEYLYDSLSSFKTYLEHPKKQPKELEHQVWVKDISNVRFIGFDSNVDVEQEEKTMAWLKTILEESCSYESIDFVIALIHEPPRSEYKKLGGNHFSQSISKALDKFSNDCDKVSFQTFGAMHAYNKGYSKNARQVWLNVGSAGGALEKDDSYQTKDLKEYVFSSSDYGFTLLDIQAGDHPSIRVRRYSRGDKKIGQRNAKTDDFIIESKATQPFTPRPIFPKEDTLLNQCLLLKSSIFEDPNGIHQASHWQVAIDGNFKDSIVDDIWFQSQNVFQGKDLNKNLDLTKVEINATSPNKTYAWRVRYRNQHLQWSNWSESHSFYVKDNSKPLSENLLINGDAESPDLAWEGDIESLKYGRCNTGRAYAGKHHFVVGGVCFNQLDTGYAYQNIPLDKFKDGISNSNYAVELIGYMRNFNGADIAQMYVEFYTDSTLILRSNPLEQNGDLWKRFLSIEKIPKDANYCRVVLKGIRVYGKSNDAYFDNLSMRIIETPNCMICIGSSNVDQDKDGFCNDIDCDDKDANSYPGALEVCDQKDNDCNGFSDNGTSVTWVGAGNDFLWSNPHNWNQNSMPLSCQEVIINTKDSVIIDTDVACKSIDLGKKNILLLKENAFLNFTAANQEQAALIKGKFVLNGKCKLNTNAPNAFEVSGRLELNGTVDTQDIFEEQLVLKKGGKLKGVIRNK